VDLVDEQHVALLEVGQGRREVAGARKDGARRHAQPDAHLLGHDPRERRLAEAGRAGEQEMVRRVTTTARGLEHDREVLD